MPCGPGSRRHMNRLGPLRTLEPWERTEGSPAPFGATWLQSEQAWNFALFSRHATSLTLLLYDDSDLTRPILQHTLDPIQNKTGPIWHCFIPKQTAPRAQYFAWRAEGPSEASHGLRFDPQKVLLDPFASTVYFPKTFSREAAIKPGSNEGRAPLGVLPNQTEDFDWGGAPPPRHTHDTVVYELHVKGFTA